MDLDILEFRVPEVLFSVFSSFGPLYLLKVFPNPPPLTRLLLPHQIFLLVSRLPAQRSTDWKKLLQSSPLKVTAPPLKVTDPPLKVSAPPLKVTDPPLKVTAPPLKVTAPPLKHCTCSQGQCTSSQGHCTSVSALPLKVRLSSRQTPHFLSVNRPLSHARCLDLANHCLGFNGPEVLLQRRCRMQRTVRERALQNAFSAVLLILTGEGKVMVEVSQTSDQILPEQPEGLLQVNEFSWGEFAAEEEEGEDEEWDLT
ncbi:RAD52 motif-containing protein 1 [Dissostichus eleginoides]|uniref:RAD52 motif-containing protein 1 n=1 Tax=Dissostichus eleginoides TaxID=100907 RepID=A0AAD9B1C7_DISEL|nr:RAD52 motif-containing protein 1 [Dissostichus eleginoides]